MATAIPNLWPVKEISLDVLTPLAILRTQATRLREFTKGILEAEVLTISEEEDILHHFDIIAPALDNYRQRILTVRHDVKDVYPAYFDDLVEYKDTNLSRLIMEEEEAYAHTDQEFMKTLGTIFGSKMVKSILSSLIARSNETQVAFQLETEEAETVPE